MFIVLQQNLCTKYFITNTNSVSKYKPNKYTNVITFGILIIIVIILILEIKRLMAFCFYYLILDVFFYKIIDINLFVVTQEHIHICHYYNDRYF